MLWSPWKWIIICNLKLTWGWSTWAKSRMLLSFDIFRKQPMYGIPSHNHTLVIKYQYIFQINFQTSYMFHISFGSSPFSLCDCSISVVFLIRLKMSIELHFWFFFLYQSKWRSITTSVKEEEKKHTFWEWEFLLLFSMNRFRGRQKPLKSFNINIIKATSENGVNFLLWREARQSRKLSMLKMLLRNSNMRSVCVVLTFFIPPTPSILVEYFSIHHIIQSFAIKYLHVPMTPETRHRHAVQ